ncbi:MAG: hypothetical protein LQ348_003194 [Seirophora lacunosa]|nr:MAG: hypothetical protein LQ348_003194 [Seirophora lacunosa]
MDHSSSSTPKSETPNPSATTDPSTLPQEAIDLATRFFNAARTGDLPIFEQSIPAGLPANLTNDKGDTLLMLASYHTHPELVSYLLARGADPNTLNERGQSPLAGAVFQAAGAPGGHGAASAPGSAVNEDRSRDEWENEADRVVQMLLDAGADVDKGRPSARESVEMFKVERWKGRFDENRAESGA